MLLLYTIWLLLHELWSQSDPTAVVLTPVLVRKDGPTTRAVHGERDAIKTRTLHPP